MVVRWTPTVNFNISTGISPAALEPSKCYFFPTCCSVLPQKKCLLILKVFCKTSPRVIGVPREVFGSFFKSSSAVMFIKKEFSKSLHSVKVYLNLTLCY